MFSKTTDAVWRVLLIVCISAVLVSGEFNLTILHTNDVHARIEDSDSFGGPCTPELSKSGDCYGGASRIRTMVEERRRQYPNATLLLDAGDQFQGTLWYYVFEGAASADFMNLIKYDAMAIGNHEFDHGIKGLSPFAHNVSFPLLASNMDLSNAPDLKDAINKSAIIRVGDHKIGIVGYTTTDTPSISFPENVTFTDELEAIQEEIDMLVEQNIKIIIALGHSGYSVDMDLGRQLKNVDVIVGGHTNTFLYTGKDPSNEKAQGKYPTEVVSIHGGHKVLVVQDYAFGKYLGELHVTFNDDGEAIAWSGNPILLDKSVEKDKEAEKLVKKYLPKIQVMKNTVIGETYVDLLADRMQCRTTECNLGNLITDAMVQENLRQSDDDSWTDVAIALVNSGSFRASIQKGNITIEKVIYVQPFRNTVDIIEIRGETLRSMLEFAVSTWNTNPSGVFGGFLQVSGLQVTYDVKRPVGSRIVELLAVCTKCRVPKLEPVYAYDTYKVLLSVYIADGGEGFTMFPDAIISRRAIGLLDTDIMLNYIKAHSPITTGLQNRIRHLKDINPKFCSGVGHPVPSIATTLIILLIYVCTIYIF